MATISPVPFLQFIDANGAPLAGGKLYTNAASSGCYARANGVHCFAVHDGRQCNCGA